MIANYNKVNEDFLDNVRVEDEVRDDVDVTSNGLSFEYDLRIDFKNKEVADKLGIMLTELAEHQPEITQYGYFPRVNNIDIENGVFELEFYDNKMLGEPFNILAFNCDFRTAYAAMRFIVNVCKIMQRFEKHTSFTVENIDGEDCEVECDKLLKYLKKREINQDSIYPLYRATHVLMDDYNELKKTERCLTMILEMFDIPQAIVNNFPQFYLSGGSKVVFSEDVPTIDGLVFDLSMFSMKFENTTKNFLVIEDYDIIRPVKSLFPSFAGSLFTPNGYSPNYSATYQKDMLKRKLSFHNSQINIINHTSKYYATLLFSTFIGYTHYSNVTNDEIDDHSQLVFASFATQVQETDFKSTLKTGINEFINAIYETSGKQWSIDRKQLEQTLEQAITDAWK